MRQSTFPRSGVLVLGANSVQSLLPSTLVSQAESLLESHRIEDTVYLADQQRKKLQAKLVDEDEADELRYVYQRIGFQCLAETLFEDAGKHLLAGELDPRVLVSYFPDLRGSLFASTDALKVFAGVAEHMPPEPSVDEIVRNYSPHLAPNTRSAPPTAELRKVLGMAAREMLELFLKKCRARRQMGEATKVTRADEVVDTVLAKIYAESGNTQDLYTLIQESNSLVLSEIEPVFRRTGQYNALCMIYRQRGDDEALLDAWSKIADGEWTDEDVPDPLSDMFSVLSDKRDRVLIQKWGIWLTRKDPDRALKLLTARDSSKRRERAEDDLVMLREIQHANPIAGAQFLEHLVLQKRSMNADLHMQLAMGCVDQSLAYLADESVAKLWRAKSASYASSNSDASFLSYFASTTPESEHKRVRLKTVLFLQGSSLYDAKPIYERLAAHDKLLKLELAIIDGKLGNHRSALAALVHDLRDATSAEAYCTLGGEVVPVKTAQSIGEKYGLRQWSAALFSTPEKSAPALERQRSVDDGLKKELLRILLEVYMQGGESTADRTAHLLNSQAINLDVVDVISLVPPNWPLNVMSSFLARSFRRTLHTRHEGQIVKAISAGQNLEVADRTWLVLREQGAIVEEAVEGDDDGEHLEEKGAILEKVDLHVHDDGGVQLAPGDPPDVDDIHVTEHKVEADSDGAVLDRNVEADS